MELVQDEDIFAKISFMKWKLYNWLSMHVLLVVGFKSQKFFTLEDFTYNVAYNNWCDERKWHCDA
jgi:hypothetical protein